MDTENQVINEKCIVQAKLELARNYLLQIGKNIGDTVTWSFTNFHGTSSKCYQGLKTCLAEIKQHDDGTVYIQSLEACKNGFQKWNGKFGRQRGDYWEYEETYPCVELIKISCLALKIGQSETTI